MNLGEWTKARLAGALFIIVGLMQLATEDYTLALVWGLLGLSMIMRAPGAEGGLSPGNFERSPRNYVALAAIALAIVLLILSFAGVL